MLCTCLLRTAYIVWLAGQIWGSLIAHEETMLFWPMMWTVALSGPVMFALSGWFAAKRTRKDIAFIYPALVVAAWFIVNPVSAVLHYRDTSVFWTFLTRQFSLVNAVFHGVHILFFLAAYLAGQRMSIRPVAARDSGN